MTVSNRAIEGGHSGLASAVSWTNLEAIPRFAASGPSSVSVCMNTFYPRHWIFLRLLCLFLGALTTAGLQAQTPQDPGRSAQVFLTSPASGTQLPSGPLKLEAVAVDPLGGPVTQLEFLADGQVIARSDRSDDVFATVIGLKVLHQAVWESPTPGIHVLEARAVQNLKTLATSSPIRVIIGPGVGDSQTA